MDDVLHIPTRRKLDVHDYHRMGEAGILGEDDRVELIDGDIIDMAPIGADHISTVNRLNRVLHLACGDRAIVSVQNPVRLDNHNEPQPDFALLRPRDDWYARDPFQSAADTLLLIEVAHSSLRFDRTVKLPLYARSGVPELWIINLPQRSLEAHADPVGNAFRSTRTYGPDDRVTLWAAPDIEIALAAVFG